MERGRRVALVTGGSAGFGRAAALTLAHRGETVYRGFRGTLGGWEARAEALVRDAAGLDGRLEPIRLDITDDASVATAVATIVEREGCIDVLANVAGVGIHGPWPTIDVGLFRSQLEVHLVGTYRMCLAVEPYMRAQGDNQARAEHGQPGGVAVGERIAEIAEIAEEDDPPFHNRVGASPVRSEGPDDAAYEDRVFRFYDLRRFR